MYQIRIILKICSIHNAAFGDIKKNAVFFSAAFRSAGERSWHIHMARIFTDWAMCICVMQCNQPQATAATDRKKMSGRERGGEKIWSNVSFCSCAVNCFAHYSWLCQFDQIIYRSWSHARTTVAVEHRVSQCIHSSTHSHTGKNESDRTTKIPKRQRQQQFIFRIALNASIFIFHSVPIHFSSSPHRNKYICIHICVHSLIYEILKLNHALICVHFICILISFCSFSYLQHGKSTPLFIIFDLFETRFNLRFFGDFFLSS